MSEHTPGPWDLMSGMPTNVIGSSGIRVARCDFDGDFSHPECAANAHLIAAAPDMYEALERAMSYLIVLAGSDDSEAKEIIIACQAAIAKAEGR